MTQPGRGEAALAFMYSELVRFTLKGVGEAVENNFAFSSFLIYYSILNL